MSIGNPRIELLVRNPTCTSCKLYRQADGDDRCITAKGNHTADVMIVTKVPLTPRAMTEMTTYLKRAGFNVADLAFTSASKCLTWDLTANKTDQKACKPYFDKEVEAIRPKWILAVGNEALSMTAGKSGIMKHRGLTYDGPLGSKVIATISPAMVYRNPGQKSGFEADLKYFYNMVHGNVVDDTEPDEIHYVWTKDELRALIETIKSADEVSFDLETSSFDEFKPDSQVITVAVTTVKYGDDAMHNDPGDVWTCSAIALSHPESPWFHKWRQVLQLIAKWIRRVRKRIAHNGKFDCRWMHQFNATVKLTFDTMLGAALLDENRPKGLKPLARSLLGAPPWDIQIKHTEDNPWWMNLPLIDILRYNALDTWHTMRLAQLERADLLKQPRLAKLMQRILVPASNALVPVEQRGVWASRVDIQKNHGITIQELDRIEAKLLEYVPDDHPYVIARVLKNGDVRYNPNNGVNWNRSNFLIWLLFEHLGLPIIARGKDNDDGSPGMPSVAEDVMLELQGKHPIIDLLMERQGWEKNRQFFTAYLEQMDDNDRIHTTFKLTGTVTGRLSSGKGDDDKVKGKVSNRGVNLQQVPRDSFVRGVFGAAPGNYFVEADYSQVELRVAAYLAQERTMLELYRTGQDIHMAMAMRMTGKPASQITKEERKMAKAVNFGFLYGMGWRKFIQTALSNYGLRVNEYEARASRTAFFDEFNGLPAWHASQRRFAHKHGYVVSPIGRIRHLPDIHSHDDGVSHEAERQAINSPVQSFASDMALWSMVLIDDKFKRLGLRSAPIGAVHDAVNFEIPTDEMSTALPIIKHTMENLPLEKHFNVSMNVPIIADLKAGSRWGGATELTDDQIWNWTEANAVKL